jgi:hypothetical protein
MRGSMNFSIVLIPALYDYFGINLFAGPVRAIRTENRCQGALVKTSAEWSSNSMLDLVSINH